MYIYIYVYTTAFAKQIPSLPIFKSKRAKKHESKSEVLQIASTISELANPFSQCSEQRAIISKGIIVRVEIKNPITSTKPFGNITLLFLIHCKLGK